ncbi:LPXTG cell wall anchor domain-containing protein [Arthrobacter sp. zg-Y820]|nr:LPXTG cell wall anchor domain-containing protein [Arthrobacter sp. zg-Y820]MCC9197301.1 LPXTG cell wall anchor domain-containing protein [Arthrobacter sp. zg-Y820]MDK1280166.1 LPXTG cell wall anchor domain-containing protein [Arthrobacter sp. zg.Y820]WIB09458.1 LPXTG cell wall anchor domain-containing protein [Arthrobacter sp. zg-Y820]
MQDNSSAFYKRVGALGAATALAVSGAFIASPAMASPTGEPDTTSTDAPVTTATEAPASETTVDETVTEETAPEEAVNAGAEVSEEAGTLPPGLAEALLRDLGMTVEEFEAAGELGKKAADALPELQATEGFVSVAIEDEKIVITGSGEALEALALELDATLVAPAEEVTDEAEATEAPAEETAEAPAAEATEAAEEPAAEEETAAPVSLSGDPREIIKNLRTEYISSVGVESLQSIMLTADGYVIRAKNAAPAAVVDGSVVAERLAEAAGTTPADAFAKNNPSVAVVDVSGPAKALEDVVNGQGYATFTGNSGGSCSIGFNAFNASGDAAVISAGHCANDGAATDTILTVPANDTAGGGSQPSLASPLGTWGFSQFGGENNSPTEFGSGENIGTDIGVINGINGELDLLPEVTQWTNPEDLTANTVKITGTTDAVVGAPMCKSGRTTGWSCGEVSALGEFYVGAADGDRGVWGFESTLDKNAAPGDSGGSVISGSNAMGLVSAGPEGGNYFFSTSLSDGMTRLEGYSVAVFVDAPQLTSHENKGTVLTDEAISGTTTGTSVKLTRDGETVDLDVVDGKWSFNAPSTVPEGGTLEFKVQAINGFNKSKTATYELTVKEAPLAVPAITNPADGAAIADAVTTITGTGFAGAEVSLNVTGDNTVTEDNASTLVAVEESGTATVAADGTWEWKLDEALTYGKYSVTASQDGIAGKAKSPTATSTFSVFLETPAVTSITEGQDFAEGENPADISGTGTAGAKVDVTIGENTLSATVGDNGDWKVTGFPVLVPGSYTVSAVQTLEGATSAPAEVTFTVTEVVVEEAAPPVVPPAPAPDNNGDGLPDTGAAGMGLFAGAGLLLTAGGISALLINRRRQLQDA